MLYARLGGSGVYTSRGLLTTAPPLAPYGAWHTPVGWGMPSPEQIRSFRALIAKAPRDSLQEELDKCVYKGWKRFSVRREIERRPITHPPSAAITATPPPVEP